MRASSTPVSIPLRIAGLFLDNPVLRQQLVARLRSPDAAWVHLGLLAVLSVLVVATWPVNLLDPLVLLQHGQWTRLLLDAAVYVYVSVAIPVIGAPLFAGEKERGSYDLLLTAPLDPLRLVLGKLGVPLAYGLIVLLSVAPFAAALLLTGGVGWQAVTGDFLVLLCFLLAIAAGTLLCSALTSTSRMALLLSLAFSLALAPIGAFTLWARVTQGSKGDLLAGVVLIGTLVLVTSVVMHLRGRVLYPPDRDVTAGDPDERAELDDPPPLMLTLDRSRFPDKYVVPPRWCEQRPLQGNPIYEKMIRVELFGRGTGAVRWLIQASCYLSVPVMAITLIILPNYYHLYFLFLVGYAVLVAGAIGGGSIASEHEQGTAELVRTTCLRHTTVLFGKWLGTLRLTLALLALVTVVQVGVPGLLLGYRTFTLFLLCTVLTVPFVVFVCLVAVFFSALVRRGVWAQLLAYSFFLLTLVGLWAGRELTPQLRGPSTADVGAARKAAYLADLFSPVNMVYVCADTDVKVSRSFAGPVLRDRWISLAGGYVAIYAVACAIVLVLSLWAMKRRWGPE